MKIRLPDEYHYPSDPVRAARWDRLENVLRRVRALQDTPDVYLPPALRARAAKLERWARALNDAICVVGDAREVFVALGEWVQTPMYSSIVGTYEGGYEGPVRPEIAAMIEEWAQARAKKQRPRGTRWRFPESVGWNRTPKGQWIPTARRRVRSSAR